MLQGVRDAGGLQPGQSFLVNEAAAAFVTAGRARPVVDRRYSLGEVPAALRYLGEGRTRGKSVVTV